MAGLDYVMITIPEEQVVFVEQEQERLRREESWCCRNIERSAVVFNVICCGMIIGALIYGFIWIAKTYP